MGQEASISPRKSIQIKPPSYHYPDHELSRTASKSKSKSRSKTLTKSLRSLRSKSRKDNEPSILSSSFMIDSKTKRPHIDPFKDLDLSKISNGITGTYICARVVKIAAQFWFEHIVSMTLKDRLEIACSVYFGMMVKNGEMKRIIAANMKNMNTNNIESAAVKFLDMMGWLLRALLKSDENVTLSLQQLGILHINMGVNMQHFDLMLKSVHETFSYYFPIKYGIQVKYAMDQIFDVTTRFMTTEHPQKETKLFHVDDIKEHSFLQSLTSCLKSTIGREYLYKYLQQTFCDEIAIFLQSVAIFKVSHSDKERFMVARNIVKSSIEPVAEFPLNISFDNRVTCMANMKKLERTFFESDNLKVSKDLFQDVEKEIYKLIMDNHWTQFTRRFANIENESVSL